VYVRSESRRSRGWFVTEIQLRVAQANNALKRLREAIGYKSFLYWSRIRPEKTKKHITQAYDAIHASNHEIKSALRAYNQARWALNQLDAPRDTCDPYKPIRKKDTRALTMVYDGNAQGQRNIALPWFWNMAVADDSSGSTYMEQGKIHHFCLGHELSLDKPTVYQVNWLRAKARYD